MGAVSSFSGLLGGALPFDYIGQGMMVQNVVAQATLSEVDPAGLQNAYQPPPPSEQELARREVDRLRKWVNKTDWLWWGWFAGGVTAAILVAVL